MAILLDTLIEVSKRSRAETLNKNGGWFIAKPVSYFSLSRFRDSWLVLTGKAVAVQYASDFFNKEASAKGGGL